MNLRPPFLLCVLLAALTLGTSWAEDKAKPAKPKPIPPTGYTDTPMIPGQKWRVHDDNRPRPAVVTPGESFSHGAPAPSDAVVLFDGTDLSKWKSQKTGEDAEWIVENGYMEVKPGTGAIMTRDEFGDFQLHIEFATPAEVESGSQGRGNSGVIIYNTYEVQVLDSYDNKTYADGQAGALYGQSPPLRNASKKPGEWQSYDIIFETPRWEGEDLVKPAALTVIHNGVVLHNRKELSGPTGHKKVFEYKKHDPQGSIFLQDHRNPMRFRNIWIRPLGTYDEGE